MDILPFLKALISDWISLMSGAIGLILTGVGLARPTANQRKSFLLFAVLSLLVACARIWTNEYRGKNQANGELAKLAQPDFRVRIEQLNVGFVDADRTAITFEVSVRNLGAPSIIDAYDLKIDAPQFSGCKFDLFQIPPGGITLHETNRDRTFPPGSALFDKAAVRPIVTGGKVVGVLLYMTTCMKPNEVMDNLHNLRLAITDVTGSQVIAQIPTGSLQGSGLYHPGINPDPNQ